MHYGKKHLLMICSILLLSLLTASSASAKTETVQTSIPLAPIVVDECLESRIGPGPTVTECSPATTGRWIQTYLRLDEEHWVTKCLLYVPEFINNEDDARAWRWSDEVLADLCSLEDEPQTWQGIYHHTEKETVRRCVKSTPTYY